MAGPVTGTGSAGSTGAAGGVSGQTGPGPPAPPPGGWTQTTILEALGVTPAQLPLLRQELNGNGRLQQFYNIQATLHGLPEPFVPSALSAVIQDLLPILAIVGVGAATGGAAGGTAAGSAEGNLTTSIASQAAQGAVTFLFPAALASLLPWDSTAAGSELDRGYHAFRYAFQAALPSLRHQMDLLAHRGIGG